MGRRTYCSPDLVACGIHNFRLSQIWAPPAHERLFARISVPILSWILGEDAEVLERPEFTDVISPADRIGVILKLRAAGHLVKPVAVALGRLAR